MTFHANMISFTLADHFTLLVLIFRNSVAKKDLSLLQRAITLSIKVFPYTPYISYGFNDLW